MESFKPDFFINNRQKLRAVCDSEVPIVITANGSVQRAGDVAYDFRQDNNFWYLTGVEQPELILVMANNREFIILPERDAIADIFDGFIDTDKIRAVSGIQTIYDSIKGWEELRILASDYKELQTCVYKGYEERHNLYINPARPRLVSNLKKLHDNLELVDIRREFAQLRMIKQEPEIAALQRAIDITAESFKTLFKAGWNTRYKDDRQLRREIDYEFSKRGARGHGYSPVIASGINACTLHHSAQGQKFNAGELVLIDIGAEYGNYSADITRTFSAGKPTKRQQAVFDAVLDVQTEIYKLLKPGLKMRSLEKKAEKLIGKKLVELGLAKRPTRALVRKYYPHAFGHHLGLDVHDSADYDLPLRAGMVITVEPGLYIPEEGIGVRIEDDVLITKGGHKVLSAGLPSRLR